MVSNSVGQTTTLDSAIQLVTQFVARGKTHAPSVPEHALAPSFQDPHKTPTPAVPTPAPARHPDAMELGHI